MPNVPEDHDLAQFVGMNLNEEAWNQWGNAVRAAPRPVRARQGAARARVNELLAGGALVQTAKVKKKKEISAQTLVWDWGSNHMETRASQIAHNLLPDVEIPTGGNRCIGLEVEVENVNLDPLMQDAVYRYWDGKPDGSLRNGHEFVSHYGLTANLALTGARILEKAVHALTSFRCGLHVHVNFQESTLQDIWRVLILYSLVEKFAFQFSGDRTSNKFCVPVHGSLCCVPSLLNYGHENEWELFAENLHYATKYQSMNLRPLYRFGTIEFRQHRGTTSYEEIKNWVVFLLELCQTEGRNTGAELLQRILNSNTQREREAIIVENFPESSKHMLRTPEFFQGVEEGIVNLKTAICSPPFNRDVMKNLTAREV